MDELGTFETWSFACVAQICVAKDLEDNVSFDISTRRFDEPVFEMLTVYSFAVRYQLRSHSPGAGWPELGGANKEHPGTLARNFMYHRVIIQKQCHDDPSCAVAGRCRAMSGRSFRTPVRYTAQSLLNIYAI